MQESIMRDVLPADCRGTHMKYVMRYMTRASQQECTGILECAGKYHESCLYIIQLGMECEHV